MNFCFDHWELDDRTFQEPFRTTSSSSKKVKYAKTCAVILIPSREEYFNAGINLWYDRKDLKLSQYQASIELKHLMEENPVLTMEAAMTYLYQPKIEIFYRNVDCWFSGRSLNLLVIDRNTKSGNDTINDIINSQKNWRWSACVAHSGEIALQMIKNGSQTFDIVLIDESVGGTGGLSFSALVTIFRSVFGDTLFIGCTVNDPFENTNAIHVTANASKKEALKAGCDFVWKRPISKFARMLPILLATRNKLISNEAIPAVSSPTPPPRNRSSERSLASLDGLRDQEGDENDYNEYEDTFANRIKGLIKFHDKFELPEECVLGGGSSVGLEIESILENVHIHDYKDLVEDKRTDAGCRTFPESLLKNLLPNDSDPNSFVGYKSDSSEGSGSTTGNNSKNSDIYSDK